MANHVVTKMDRRKVKPAGYRSDVGKLDRLIESIKTEGLHRPLILSPGNVILSGERRYAALDKLAKPEVPVIIVSDLATACELLAEDVADRTAYLSLRPGELAGQLDTILSSGLSTPTSPTGRPLSTPPMLAKAIGVYESTVTSLLIIYRTANYGLTEEECEWGREALGKINDGLGISPTRHWLTKKLAPKYGRVDYRYIELQNNHVGSPHPTAISSAADQRHTLGSVAGMMTTIGTTLRTFGPLNTDLSQAERTEFAKQLRAERVALTAIISTLEGKTR